MFSVFVDTLNVFYLHRIVQNGCNIFSDLSNMYRLLNPIQNGLCVLIQEVEDHIKHTGLDAVKALKSGEKVDKVSSRGSDRCEWT